MGWRDNGRVWLEGVTIGLRKDGNLPVEITGASIMVGDAPASSVMLCLTA